MNQDEKYQIMAVRRGYFSSRAQREADRRRFLDVTDSRILMTHPSLWEGHIWAESAGGKIAIAMAGAPSCAEDTLKDKPGTNYNSKQRSKKQINGVDAVTWYITLTVIFEPTITRELSVKLARPNMLAIEDCTFALMPVYDEEFAGAGGGANSASYAEDYGKTFMKVAIKTSIIERIKRQITVCIGGRKCDYASGIDEGEYTWISSTLVDHDPAKGLNNYVYTAMLTKDYTAGRIIPVDLDDEVGYTESRKAEIRGAYPDAPILKTMTFPEAIRSYRSCAVGVGFFKPTLSISVPKGSDINRLTDLEWKINLKLDYAIVARKSNSSNPDYIAPVPYPTRTVPGSETGGKMFSVNSARSEESKSLLVNALRRKKAMGASTMADDELAAGPREPHRSIMSSGAKEPKRGLYAHDESEGKGDDDHGFGGLRDYEADENDAFLSKPTSPIKEPKSGTGSKLNTPGGRPTTLISSPPGPKGDDFSGLG